MKAIDSIEGSLILFPASDRLRICGFLVNGGSRRCIVSIHGMGGAFFTGNAARAVARRAKAHRISTFLLNTRGYGILNSGSFMTRRRRRMMIGTAVESFEQSVLDIKGALDLLGGIGYREFILMGHSTGCQKATYYQYKTRDRRVKGLVLLAPVDDYNLNRKTMGKRWRAAVSKAKALARQGKGNIYASGLPYAPKRFLSVADLRNAEARIFNYEGEMREFSSVKVPVYAVFGTRDDGRLKPVAEYLSMLKRRSGRGNVETLKVNGSDHSFKGYEERVAVGVVRWLGKIS